MLSSMLSRRMFSSASSHGLRAVCQSQIDLMRESGTYKTERVITSAQGMEIDANGQRVINFCANNYLGLSNHPRVVEAAQ